MKTITKARQTALPLYLEGTNNKAVLIQHGYNGYPGDMYELAKRVNAEGYTVVLPRLPGHGTNGADFRKTDWKLWLSHTRNEYINLQSRYESVSIIGLSMGGVLALLISAEFSPQKTILLAPAMAVSAKIMNYTPILKYFVPRIDRNWTPSPDDSEDRLFLAQEYWRYHFTAQIASLNKLMRMARKRLMDVESHVYLMLSEKDQSVPLKAGDIIENGLRVPVVKRVLKNSPHVFFEGEEKETAIDQVIEWLKIDEKKGN
ncbi:MAG: alpha/beta fold hydrolase [Spirochaetales bacterium]|nr:alpha/beta fold hydrolase [Spirochaetales bacterium]